jgi:hypothetical protein
MPRQAGGVGDVQQRRSSMPKRRQRRAARLCATALTAILVCAAEAVCSGEDRPGSGEAAAVTSPCEIRERRVMREERPLWRRVLALPADVLEVAFWPLRQTLFWMERDDIPDRVRDAALLPIGALTGTASTSEAERAR